MADREVATETKRLATVQVKPSLLLWRVKYELHGQRGRHMPNGRG